MKLNLTLHDAKKELPKKSCEVVCIKLTEDGRVSYITALGYSHKYKKFNCYDHCLEEDVDKNSIEIHYWAEMPERIEEEDR